MFNAFMSNMLKWLKNFRVDELGMNTATGQQDLKYGFGPSRFTRHQNTFRAVRHFKTFDHFCNLKKWLTLSLTLTCSSVRWMKVGKMREKLKKFLLWKYLYMYWKVLLLTRGVLDKTLNLKILNHFKNEGNTFCVNFVVKAGDYSIWYWTLCLYKSIFNS